MKKANDYREKQVISLTDKIVKLQETEKTMRLEQAEWNAGKKQREGILAGLDSQAFAAKKAHEAALEVHEVEIEEKKAKIAELIEIHQREEESYSHSAADHSVALIGHDDVIRYREETIKDLKKQETDLRTSISRLSSDKILAMKDTAKSLDDARRALARVTEILTEISTLEVSLESLKKETMKVSETKRVVEDALNNRVKGSATHRNIL